MAKILITWELGAGLGHLGRIRSIAVPLVADGHHVTVAIRDLRQASFFFGDLPVVVLQAPVLQGHFANSYHPPASFPHVLHNCCCAEPDVFHSLVGAWQNLFRLVNPDLVLFDFSPTAIFASRGSHFLRANVGMGFYSPPNKFPLPNWRPESAAIPDQILADECGVLSRMNDVAARLGQKELQSIGAMYDELDHNFLATYPELDHYGPRNDGEYVGTWPSRLGAKPQWNGTSGFRVFAYLKQNNIMPVLLYHLVQLGLPTVIYAPGAMTDEFLTRFRASQSTVEVADEAVDLEAAAAQCDFGITNGTHATVTSLLKAGKPTLNLPNTLEQRILSERVQQLGAGITLLSNDSEIVRTSLEVMLTTASLSDEAKSFRRRHGYEGERDDLKAFHQRLSILLN